MGYFLPNLSPLLSQNDKRQRSYQLCDIWSRFFPIAGQTSSCLCSRLRRVQGTPGGLFLRFLSSQLRIGFRVGFGFPFLWCTSPKCLSSDWPATWSFTSSDWRVICIAILRLRSDFIHRFCDSDLWRFPIAILSLICSFLCVSNSQCSANS